MGKWDKRLGGHGISEFLSEIQKPTQIMEKRPELFQLYDNEGT